MTVAIPARDEEAHIEACLDAVANQTYPAIAEVLVVDGGSTDATTALAAARDGVTVLDNPRRMQAAALNIALAYAAGEIFVRVDAHCVIEPDYVERCVDALQETGAALVGGGMTPVAEDWFGRGVVRAMTSPLGAGPARFHVGGEAGWTETVYLGAGRTDRLREIGGYAEDVGVNEDTELAFRAGSAGGVWFAPDIRSAYVPRSSLRQVARQFVRYGLSRAATSRRHPASVRPRQLAPPLLVLALVVGPRRRFVLAAYASVVVAASARVALEDREAAVAFATVLPTMHLCWGGGFLAGMLGCPPPGRAR